MHKRSKKRLPPSSSGEPSTSTSDPPAAQDALTRSSEATSTNRSADSVPTSSSNDLVGDIITKSAVAPAVHKLPRAAPGKHAQGPENPSASTSRSAGPASFKKRQLPSARAVVKNAAGTSRKPTDTPKAKPAARKRAASSATSRGPASSASRLESGGSRQTAAAEDTPLPCTSAKTAHGSLASRPTKRRAGSERPGPSVVSAPRAESPRAPPSSLSANGAVAGLEAPVLAFSGAPVGPPPQWGISTVQAAQYVGGPSQAPQVPSAAWDPPIEDAEMEDLSDAIGENLQNQVPLADQKGTFVITDTNIFLHNLDLVRRLTALDSGPPDVKVCIPWMAIQELDHIKNCKRGVIARSAVAAIAFINKALVAKNPKFRGQTIAEARTKENCMPKDFNNNDDHFVHCCIVVANTGNRVLLLSNDVNLRNKALINNIQTFSAAEMEAILDREFGGTRTQVQPGSSTAKEPAADNLVSAAPVPQSESAVWEEVRGILRKNLSLVLENELQSAFGDLWPRVVAVKPPWTEETALECVLKHFIALTGTAFKSSLKKVIENLLSVLRKQDLQPPGTRSLVQLSLVLCTALQVHYYPLAGDVARLSELHQSLQNGPDHTSPADQRIRKAKGGAEPRRTFDRQQAAGATAQAGPSSAPTIVGLNKVLALFDDIWLLVNEYCGFLSVKRGVDYRLPFQARRGFRCDALVQVESFKHVSYILEQFQHLLKAPFDKRKTMLANTDFCLKSIKRLAELLTYEGREPIRGLDTTPEEVAQYFANPAHDAQLHQAAEQLRYMHQSIGYSTIDAVGQKPALTSKK